MWLIILGLFYIYIVHLLFILNIFAHFLSYLFIFFRIRDNVISYNLNLIFPKKSKKEITKIKFQSTKITILNILILFHQRIIYYFPNLFIRNYYDFSDNSCNEFIKDVNCKNNKILLITPHYGIFCDHISFYHFVSAATTTTAISVCHLAVKKKIINNFIYSNNLKKSNFIFLKQNCMEELINCKDNILTLRPDQKLKTNKLFIFLKQTTNFNYSPSIIAEKTNRKIWIVFLFYNLSKKKIQYKFIDLSKEKDIKNNSSYSHSEITQKIADIFSREIFNNPEQYFWIYDRFN